MGCELEQRMNEIIIVSQKIYQFFSKRKRRQKLRILLHHPKHGFGLFGVESVLRVVNKVASGTEFAILMLMEIPAHLLSKRRLMHHQLLQSMSKEAILPVNAVPILSEPLAQLDLTLAPRMRYRLIVQNRTHDQKPIILLLFPSTTKATPQPTPLLRSHPQPLPSNTYLQSYLFFSQKKKKFRFRASPQINQRINVSMQKQIEQCY